MADRAQSAVALGGGHGLAATLTALGLLLDDLVLDELTAVVTVADDGGSSGRLRAEFGVLPPGDLRMALAALCREDPWRQTWADVLQHRFAGRGDLHDHSLGNLLIVGLWELLGDPVAGLDVVGKLLRARGRVLPMALTPLDIVAEVRGRESGEPDALSTVRGQVEVATTTGMIESIRLEPADPDPCPEAVASVRAADWVVLGPGSWFTSVIPHLLVPDLRDALTSTDARIVLVLNLAEQPGETQGFGPADHLAVLLEHAPDLRVHTVLADRVSVGEDQDTLARLAATFGAELVLADLARGDGTPRHEPRRLADALAGVLAAPRSHRQSGSGVLP